MNRFPLTDHLICILSFCQANDEADRRTQFARSPESAEPKWQWRYSFAYLTNQGIQNGFYQNGDRQNEKISARVLRARRAQSQESEERQSFSSLGAEQFPVGRVIAQRFEIRVAVDGD